MPNKTSGEFGQNMERRVAETRDAVAERMRTAEEMFDESRSTAADHLQNAGATVHERADVLPGGERVRELAHSAADRLSTTADYMREHDIKRMKTDVETLVKNNPGPALLIAVACGFLLGRALIRD